MKKVTVTIVLMLAAGAAGFLLAKGQPFLELPGSPTVTIVNLTGGPISDATVILGPAQAQVGNLKHTQSRTVTVRDQFGESATNVEWTDSNGTHRAIADDYMEQYGFYHSTVVLTADRKAIAVREMRESNN
jgi:hypothetical protein